ncbi:MAG: ribulose-phosphate 3-epimerase [Actinomycetota bacterium]
MVAQLAPSILNADFAHLADEIARVAEVADMIHVDVMDNHFVPNLTLGPVVVESLRKATDLPFDCHLMIADPDRWAAGYAELGAAMVTFHVEAAADAVQTARGIRVAGAKAGLALKPDTAVLPYADILAEFDMLLVMTVEPGFGGQKFRADCLDKVREARRLMADRGVSLWLEVDGGVGRDTIEACAEAGADVFVVGTAIYAADDPAEAARSIKAMAQQASRLAPRA